MRTQVFQSIRGPILLLMLTIVPTIMPRDPWVSILKGESQLDAELRQAGAHGYYENLLTDSLKQDEKPGNQGLANHNEQKAPPGWRPFAESGIVEPVSDYLRWRMKPNLDIEWNGVRFSTNSLGYRTPEIEIPKPSGTYRIVVLGSSNTMGHGVGDHEMYVRLLERWLNRETAGLGKKVEVVNLAVSSDSPSQNLLRLQVDVPALEPDWILNDITVIDYSLEELHLRSTVRQGKQIPFRYISEIVQSSGVTPDDSPAQFSAKLRSSIETLLEGAYEGWARESQAIGSPIALLHLPRTDAELENRNLKRLAERLARRHSLPMIDLSQAYQNHSIDEYRLSPWDKHPSVLGHRLIFEELRNELIRQGGCPGLPFEAEADAEAAEGQPQNTLTQTS